jgi:amino acid adenylation domain-containing protein
VEFAEEDIEQSISARFEKMARLYPDQVAVKSTNQVLTYEELNVTANRIAHSLLRECGDQPEPIALLADHDGGSVAAMLAILKAGKICMPLDPALSRERLAFMLKDSQAKTLLVSSRNRDSVTGFTRTVSRIVNHDGLDSRLPVENPNVPIEPDALAYIEYTSGSTGQAKGIIQTHRIKLQRVLRNTNSLHICQLDRIALFSYLVTAWGSQASLNALLNGATLACFDAKEQGIIPLAQWLRAEEITLYASAPTLFRSLANTLSEPEPFPEIRVVRLNGERIRRGDLEIYRKYFSASCILEVSLAASETGTFCQYFFDQQSELAENTVPVGYAADGVEVLLLNDAGERVGFGTSGEIAIKSSFCSIGYWRRPEETRAKFLTDSLGSDDRIFISGDLGRLRPDGCLEYLGRKDFLVKIRGYRVELGEVEETLRSCESVQEAAVVFRSADGDEGRLVAYVVSNGTSPITATSLRRVLKQRLPDYMIPSAFILLETMPTTATGKIDRQALPDLDKARPALDLPYVKPRSRLEKKLAKIWGEVLSIDPIGIHDNFFDLGGHSLAATRVISRLIQEFHLELPIKTLFESPTVAAMSAMIMQNQENKAGRDDLERILSEVEAMSNEEAERVLKNPPGKVEQ